MKRLCTPGPVRPLPTAVHQQRTPSPASSSTPTHAGPTTHPAPPRAHASAADIHHMRAHRPQTPSCQAPPSLTHPRATFMDPPGAPMPLSGKARAPRTWTHPVPRVSSAEVAERSQKAGFAAGADVQGTPGAAQSHAQGPKGPRAWRGLRGRTLDGSACGDTCSASARPP